MEMGACDDDIGVHRWYQITYTRIVVYYILKFHFIRASFLFLSNRGAYMNNTWSPFSFDWKLWTLEIIRDHGLFSARPGSALANGQRDQRRFARFRRLGKWVAEVRVNCNFSTKCIWFISNSCSVHIVYCNVNILHVTVTIYSWE